MITACGGRVAKELPGPVSVCAGGRTGFRVVDVTAGLFAVPVLMMCSA